MPEIRVSKIIKNEYLFSKCQSIMFGMFISRHSVDE